MNKNEIIKRLASESKVTQKDCRKILNNFAELVGNSLRTGETINLLGFGKFDVRYKNERKTYNPITKSNIIIPATKVPFFKPGKTLKQSIF